MNPKYFFVINSLIPGGAERSLVELLPALRARDIEPIVICLYKRPIGFHDEVTAGGFELRYLRPGNLISRIRQVRKMIRDEEPALVHTVLFDADIVGRFAALGTSTPVVTTLANTTYEPARIAADSNLKSWRVAMVRVFDGFTARHMTSWFHAVSDAVKKSAVKSLGVDPERVTVVYRGRDIVRLGTPTPQRRSEVRTTLGIGESTFLIITVGRHEYQKGHRVLIEAFAQVLPDRPDSVLLIAGRTGNATEDLTEQAKLLDVEMNVRFLGHRTDVPDLLASADLFVFPSLWEGLGGAAIEALALEVPILASDIPALREVVADGAHGALVPPGDVGSLASEMRLLMTDEPQRMALAEGAREHFIEQFSVDQNNGLLIDLLSSVANAG